MPETTLRSWVCGRFYPTADGRKRFQPVIRLPEPSPPVLSFVNLVEAYVLDAVRRKREIKLAKVRNAVSYLEENFQSRHPLADEKMLTDGCNLFVEKYGHLINISADGQLAIKELLQIYLRRIEWDDAGLAKRLYPFIRKKDLEEPRFVVIDPAVSFGRPVLVGTGVPTAEIADRYKAGESVDELARDYGRQRLDIEQAIRCELEIKAA
jgi:uncharacterized protein (DUF433 family)